MAPPSTPDSTPPSIGTFDTIVDVIIGPPDSSKTFKLHKGILCFYSGYFDRALNGEFEEARTGVVKLPEEKVDVFEKFVFWLYTGRMPNRQDSKDPGAAFQTLVDLWSLADRREIPLLGNNALDAFRSIVIAEWKVPTGQLNEIYACTTSTSGLRRFAIHVTCVTAGNPAEGAMSGWPRDAIVDMLHFKWDWDKSRKLNKDGLAKLNMCQFHQHEDAVTCTGKKEAGK